MAANPALLSAAAGGPPGAQALVPQAFANEAIVLSRKGVMLHVDGLGERGTAKWNGATGTVYLSQVRLVFVADKPDASGSGLRAFDFPLAYLRTERFNQPIFGSNNVSFNCFSCAPDGGPMGARPPHAVVLYFREGGVGTFLPLFFQFTEQARQLNASAPPPPGVAPVAPTTEETMHAANQAFVDPNDPSTVYLVTPLPSAPPLPKAAS